MKIYVEAFNGNGRQILGNLDGQGVIRAKNYRRTSHYKMLVSGERRPKWSKIKCWRLVNENDQVITYIENPCFIA